MKLNLNKEQENKIAAVNIAAAFEFTKMLMKDDEACEELPPNAVILPITGDPWVDEQNNLLAQKAISEGKTVYRLQPPAIATPSE